MTAPDLSAEQRAALDALGAHLARGEARPFALGGYAGTGKTTVAAALPAYLGVDPADVLYLAPTNQARNVLAGKTGGASELNTVFGHLYHGLAVHCAECPENPLNGAVADGCHTGLHDGCCWLDRERRAGTVRRALVVVDEASMVTRADHDALVEAHGGALVFVGDPAQLPPVDPDAEGDADSPALSRLDAELVEVRRTGPRSEILALAEAVRTGNAVPDPRDARGGEYRLLRGVAWPPWRWTEDDGTPAVLDAVLTQTNAHRRALNATRRAADGRTDTVPGVGDALLATRRMLDGMVYNGQRFTVAEAAPGALTLATAGGRQLRFARPDWDRVDEPGHPFCYGYALTAHRAQGSEFDRVLVYPPGSGTPAFRRRWLYTAVTRARRMVALALP